MQVARCRAKPKHLQRLASSADFSARLGQLEHASTEAAPSPGLGPRSASNLSVGSAASRKDEDGARPRYRTVYCIENVLLVLSAGRCCCGRTC